MQLQYAYILKQLLPLSLHQDTEFADLELETGVPTRSGMSNVDILVRGRTASEESRIAIELKCYRNRTATGGTRGAHDIFMKDVYEDLHILEEYVSRSHAGFGVALIMNDLERFVSPKSRKGQCWAYDISHGFTFPGGKITVPIGGKPVNISLENSYAFNWARFGDLWFAEVEGIRPNKLLGDCAGPPQAAAT